MSFGFFQKTKESIVGSYDVQVYFHNIANEIVFVQNGVITSYFVAKGGIEYFLKQA